ncbi:MAG: helix-turn-helix domain-containing protein [Clostridiaceae bacterium]|nr:helix-turn-helix domain-containing protein [Clostridiaceae bacterium]
MPESILSKQPVRIFHQSATDCRMHWHSSLCILYLLAGKAHIMLDGQHYLMHEADVLLINPYELYSSELLGSSSMLFFSFSPTIVQTTLAGMRFRCLSFLAQQKESARYDRLRAALASLFQAHLNAPSDPDLALLGRIYDVFYELKRNFCYASRPSSDDSHIYSILHYLNSHYMERISLATLAAQEHFSSNYLSQFFRDKLGTTFTQYLNDIRLQHAFLELCTTDKSITAIALDNGFSRPDNFINRFQRKYAVTPNKYRRGLIHVPQDDPQFIPQEPPQRQYHALLRYLVPQHNSLLTPVQAAQHMHIPISARENGQAMHRDWQDMINAGYADDCLTIEVQQQLADLQALIHFDYIRFHGIFNDSMHVYYENPHGGTIFHFAHTDLLLDRLLALGFKPYIEFGFLPQLLAPSCTPVYQNRCFIGFPSDLEKWESLVYHFTLHCLERYGEENVRQWRFSLFSMTFSLYGFLTPAEYRQLYLSTFQKVKQASSRLCFGGPGAESSMLLSDQNQFFPDFLHFCRSHRCVPDFISMQIYPHDLDDILNGFNRIIHQGDRNARFQLSRNFDFMADAIRAMRTVLHEGGLDRLPIVVEEWDATAWQWDMQNDTCYKSSYVIKTLTETMGQTLSKAYWTASDLIGDQKMEPKLFHGGHGLYTYNGIRKPALHALHFLARMGSHVLSTGRGWYVTRSIRGLQILLYHACPYQAEYQLSDDTTAGEERYTPFSDQPPLCFHLSISGMDAQRYTCEYFSIGLDSGNAYDEWLRLGAPAELPPDYLSYLKHRSEPQRKLEQRTNLRHLQITLRPLEVMQILISPHND